VHLVDTPGFDDNRLSDVEVLKLMAFWLSMAYSFGVRIGGIIYMQRITDLRISGTALRSLEAFKRLCGPGAFHGVTFLTTGWDIPVIGRDESVRAAAQKRQEELENTPRFAGDILAGGGASVALLPGREAALAVVDDIIRRGHNLILSIQLEMAVGSVALGETSAGRTLRDAHRREMARAAELDGQARDELAEAVRRQHDLDMRRLRDHRAALRQDAERQAGMLRDLETRARDVLAAGLEEARTQREALEAMVPPEDGTAEAGSRQAVLSRAVRAVQKVHLPSIRMGKKVEVSSAVVSALAGTASLVLTATACSVM
jgi:hypothetical protein